MASYKNLYIWLQKAETAVYQSCRIAVKIALYHLHYLNHDKANFATAIAGLAYRFSTLEVKRGKIKNFYNVGKLV